MSQNPAKPFVPSEDQQYKLRERMRYAAMRFRVWHSPQLGAQTVYVQCNTIATAISLTDVLADYDIFQYENRIKPDYANANGVQYYDHEDGEWSDFDVENELEDYREAMLSNAAMLVDGVDEPIPGWVLEPGQAMKVVRD